MTQINDRWQTCIEVDTTVDLVFQHNQRHMLQIKFFFLIYVYHFLEMFIEVKQKWCHFFESFVYLSYFVNIWHWGEKKFSISFFMFNRILEQVKIFRMFIPLCDFEILYCSFIKYVLYFRKISLLLKKILPLHSKYSSWLCV